MLEVKELEVSVAGKGVLKGFDLTVGPGELHFLLGPNGSGKSTLANALAAKPGYTVSRGTVLLDGGELLSKSPEERLRSGLMVAYQNPPELHGVTVKELADVISEELGLKGRSVETLLASLALPVSYAERFVNVDMSGGERKKMELLQALLVNPRYLVLDEIDSGLDVDALKQVAGVIELFLGEGCGILAITHQARLGAELSPAKVHVLMGGEIVATGGPELLKTVTTEGFAFFQKGAGARGVPQDR